MADYVYMDEDGNIINMTGNWTYNDYDYLFNNDSGSDDGYSPSQLRKLATVAVFYGLIFLTGVVGNSLVIYCIAKYKRMQSITNQLLLSLACADLLLTLVCIPIKVRRF